MPFATVSEAEAYFAQRLRPSETTLPVVFIHGAGGTHQHWLPQLRNLSSAPTYALDLPGHGRSEGAGHDSIGAYAEWCLAWLDALGLERAVWVGHSMGGAVTLELALRWPPRVAGLGLVATGARLRVAPAILQGIAQDFAAAVRLISRYAYGPQADPELVQLGQQQMGLTPPDVLHGDFLACDRFDVCTRLEEIRAPALVICGTQDRLTPPKYATFLHEHLADAALKLVDGAGHMVMLEQPSAVTHALHQWLARL
jgi:pimeloyl-ACP methyl ester carboxylesterase